MPFVFGNLALVVLGLGLDVPSTLRWFSVIFGVIGLVALSFFISGNYFGLGFGGMERIVAYPQTIWLIVFGAYVSAHRYKEIHG